MTERFFCDKKFLSFAVAFINKTILSQHPLVRVLKVFYHSLIKTFGVYISYASIFINVMNSQLYVYIAIYTHIYISSYIYTHIQLYIHIYSYTIYTIYTLYTIYIYTIHYILYSIHYILYTLYILYTIYTYIAIYIQKILQL